jgi:hypothetical protein
MVKKRVVRGGYAAASLAVAGRRGLEPWSEGTEEQRKKQRTSTTEEEDARHSQPASQELSWGVVSTCSQSLNGLRVVWRV